MELTKNYLRELTYEIVGAAIEVHKSVGPGLLESVYHKCLAEELRIRGIDYFSEHFVNVEYKGVPIQTKLRSDFLVENAIVVEIKAVESFAPVYFAQLLTYMKLLDVPKGILINFNVANLFQEGQKTMVNDLFNSLPQK